MGHGAVDARASVIALAEKIGAPVLTTFKGKGLIPDTHPNAAGVLGRSSTPIASWFMNEADLIISLGSSFSNHTGIESSKPILQVDFERMLAFHSENDADATMCVREYDYQIPYGVISGEDGAIVTMVEKPTYQYFVNAGIYVVDPGIFRNVPEHCKIDMPELLEQEITNEKRVLMFPIHEYWLDIGRMDDFERAQAEFHALGLD